MHMKIFLNLKLDHNLVKMFVNLVDNNKIIMKATDGLKNIEKVNFNSCG